MTVAEYKKAFLELYVQMVEEHGDVQRVLITPSAELYGVSRVSVELIF